MIIFIVGNSRSGTTLMSEILGKHPKIYSFKELHFFERLYDGTSKENLNKKKAIELLTELLCTAQKGICFCRKKNDFYNKAVDLYKKFGLENDVNISPIKIYELFLYYETFRNKKHFPCEQTPRNLYYLKEIIENISDAKIIYMIRDPRAILL